MLSHIFIGISDFDRALAFYKPALRGQPRAGVNDGVLDAMTSVKAKVAVPLAKLNCMDIQYPSAVRTL